MVTATVQCKRHQRERSDRSGDVPQIEHTPPTPHPAGRAGLEPRPRGHTELPELAAGMPQSASACLHPWEQHSAVPTPERPPHLSPQALLPRDALAGHLWDEREGGNGVGNAALGWVPPNPPFRHLGVAPPERGHSRELEFCSMRGTREEEDAQARLAPGACAEVALAGRRTLRIYRLTRSAGASQ